MVHLKKTMKIIVVLIVIFYGGLWALSSKNYPIEYGISFSIEQATSLELNWKKVYVAMLTDLKPKFVRLSVPWNTVEPIEGQFYFGDVDFMMTEAAKHHTRVLLVAGQKAPRWPECYVPGWVKNKTGDKSQYVYEYLKKTVAHFQSHPVLELWQVENEPYIPFAFGNCADFDESLVSTEIALVRSLDPKHPVLITDSGELSTWREAIHAGDLFGTTIYRVVQTPGGFNFYYDWLPAAYYRLKAEMYGRDVAQVFVAELQAEPWFTNGNALTTPLAGQLKMMSLDRLARHVRYAGKVGAPRAYLWGVEWWYWLKDSQGHPEYWEAIKNVL